MLLIALLFSISAVHCTSIEKPSPRPICPVVKCAALPEICTKRRNIPLSPGCPGCDICIAVPKGIEVGPCPFSACRAVDKPCNRISQGAIIDDRNGGVCRSCAFCDDDNKPEKPAPTLPICPAVLCTSLPDICTETRSTTLSSGCPGCDICTAVSEDVEALPCPFISCLAFQQPCKNVHPGAIIDNRNGGVCRKCAFCEDDNEPEEPNCRAVRCPSIPRECKSVRAISKCCSKCVDKPQLPKCPWRYCSTPRYCSRNRTVKQVRRLWNGSRCICETCKRRTRNSSRRIFQLPHY